MSKPYRASHVRVHHPVNSYAAASPTHSVAEEARLIRQAREYLTQPLRQALHVWSTSWRR